MAMERNGKQRNISLDVISYFATSLYDKHSIEEIYWDIAKNCIHQLGLEDCVIYQADSEKKILNQVAAYGNKNPFGRNIFNEITIPFGKGIVGNVAETGNAEIITDTRADKRYIQDDAMRLSELAVPIIVNAKVIGVIDSEHSEVNFFKKEHLQVFQVLATLCSQKIQTLKKERKKLDAQNEHYIKLIDLIEVEKIYRNPNLSLQSTAQLIGISSTYLSYLIKDVASKSFTDFINSYRIEEVKSNLLNEQYNPFTILSIGLEAGFNSKSSFNTCFKKATGKSPSQFRKES